MKIEVPKLNLLILTTTATTHYYSLLTRHSSLRAHYHIRYLCRHYYAVGNSIPISGWFQTSIRIP